MRVGIAGLGNGAANALVANPGLCNHPHVKVAAGADLRADARRMFTERFGAPAYASVEEMCRWAPIDAVYVLTPNTLHAEHSIVAAEHGKQIIADKPMAVSMAECDAMIAAADSQALPGRRDLRHGALRREQLRRDVTRSSRHSRGDTLHQHAPGGNRQHGRRVQRGCA